MDRWPGDRARPAIAAAALLAGIALALPACGVVPSAPEDSATTWQLVLRDGSDRVVLRAALPDGRFTLRYRNSLYGTLAEERFRVNGDGQLRLVDLAADTAAVLDEYYAVARRPSPTDRGDARRWRAPPAAALSLPELALAATAHGRRTLVIDGQKPVPLWPLTEPWDSTLTLVAEPRP